MSEKQEQATAIPYGVFVQMLEGALFPGQRPEGNLAGSQPQGPFTQDTITQLYTVSYGESRIFNKEET